MTIAEPKPTAPDILKLAREKRDQIAADNAAKRSANNARRWKAERDPVEYAKQLADQKEEYAAKVLAEQGREVRAYLKVQGSTGPERAEKRRQRHAEKERGRWANATQAQKDEKADKVWSSRKRKAGWTEEQIGHELAKRVADRLHRQPDPGAYEDNPNFGVF